MIARIAINNGKEPYNIKYDPISNQLEEVKNNS